MPLPRSEIRKLLEMIAATRERELSCDECLDGLASYVETELSGRSPARAHAEIRAHLEQCGECLEEHDTLLAAVRALRE